MIDDANVPWLLSMPGYVIFKNELMVGINTMGTYYYEPAESSKGYLFPLDYIGVVSACKVYPTSALSRKEFFLL